MKPRSMFADTKDGGVFGYMCKIDFECELGMACGGNVVYPSITDLKRNHKCWKSCGIVKVKVSGEKTICNEKDSRHEN